MEGELANPARIHAESVADVCVSMTGGLERPIDLVHLSRQTFGERDLESELLRLFDRQSRQIVARLTDGPVAEARWRADLAHTLKGSARAVGAFGVAAAAEAYELDARAGADPARALSTLTVAVEAAQGAIAELLAG
jgi:HPt (histidine-containing phosphotransfer) domain-containing protein